MTTEPNRSDSEVATELPAADFAVQLIEASPQPIARVDAGGRVLWSNAAMRAFESIGDSRGQRLADRLRFGDADRRRFDALLAEGGSADFDRPGVGGLRVGVRVVGDGTRAIRLGDDEVMSLRRDNERLGELLELARTMNRLGFWERDLATNRGRWDAVVFRMRGLHGTGGDAPPPAEAMEAVVDIDRPGLQQAIEASQRAPGVYSRRYRVRTRAGEVRQLHSHWLSKAGADGRPSRIVGLLMDDTETHRIARTHDEALSQLGLAAQLAGIVVWRHDFASARMHLSDEAAAVLQTPQRADGMPIDVVRELIHPDDLPQVIAATTRALRTGRPTDVETRYRRADGAWRQLMTRCVVQRDADGRAVGFVGVALDVTDRIDETRRSAELTRRLELTTRAAGIGYWHAVGEDDSARWSPELRAIHGIADDAPLPTLKDWFERWVHPHDRDAGRQAFVEWLKSGRQRIEYDLRIVRPDGEVRHLLTHSAIDRAPGRAPEMFGLLIDVTERHRVEEALRETTERAAFAARSAGLGTFEIDLATGATYWDEQMWRLRGRPPRREAPTLDERLGFVHPDDLAFVRDVVGERILGDGPFSFESRAVWPDGSVRWIASRSVALHDEHGRPQRRIGVNWDVTDSRTAEAARQEREIARRESQAKSKFLARMSHELRTPLNGVLGFAQLLRVEDDGRDAAAAARRRRADQIVAAGQHLLSLINDVLDLSRLEGGEMRIALQPVALGPLLEETVPLVEPLLLRHGVRLTHGGLDLAVTADPTRLRQVLLNLLSNAIKYNRPGGHVHVDATRRDGDVVVRVADTGRGFTDEQLSHLFEPFNRLGIEGEGIEGTGIGLAIVKALVDGMGASIGVNSRPGAGSLFELTLRAVAPTAAQPPPHAPAATAPPALARAGKRGTLLYVEDNPVNAQIVSELVARRPDLVLHVAPDGASGVRNAQSLRPDLVLLDMQLPDFDGHEVLRRLRADPTTAAIPVIALSANAMPDDIARALRAGMTDYWTKPLDFGVFLSSLDAMFGPAPKPR